LWHSNPFNIANIEAIVMAKDTASPKIRFVVDVAEVTPTPQASALIVQRLLEQLGFGSLLSELGLDKNHGVAAEEIALVLLLYSSYGVDSVAKLQEKARQDKALAEILPDVKAITGKVILYFENQAPRQWEQLLDAADSQSPMHATNAAGASVRFSGYGHPGVG